MLEYLDGNQDLAPAARTLADLWKTARSIRERLPLRGQAAPIQDPEFQARIGLVDERRIRVLFDSAAKLMGREPGGWTNYVIDRDST